MALKLFYHPLSSYSWKALTALYEKDVAFEGVVVDQDTHAELAKVWPIAKFPVLVDSTRSNAVPEATTVIEYLDHAFPASARLIPVDPDQAWRTRLWDRFFDLHVHDRMGAIVADRLRPAESKDPYGVAELRGRLAIAYCVAESEAAERTWFSGATFGLADCAAAPALYYANKVQPFGPDQPATKAYLQRLMDRPSFARVLKEAEPYLHMFPTE